MSKDETPLTDAAIKNYSGLVRANIATGPLLDLASTLERDRADLLQALTGLLADITEYQTINKLGGENNHWQVLARAAIAKATK